MSQGRKLMSKVSHIRAKSMNEKDGLSIDGPFHLVIDIVHGTFHFVMMRMFLFVFFLKFFQGTRAPCKGFIVALDLGARHRTHGNLFLLARL
mmetsp:Transcript_80071/g.232496  ORF Transcript_80071/g.232496 Transcript_80071/m.232496 type:complete len:92 (+) Transcript_80071:291-566(+)